MSADGQRIKWCRNIAENFKCLSRVHERYRRQTDGRWHIANVNLSSRSLKIVAVQSSFIIIWHTYTSGLFVLGGKIHRFPACCAHFIQFYVLWQILLHKLTVVYCMSRCVGACWLWLFVILIAVVIALIMWPVSACCVGHRLTLCSKWRRSNGDQNDDSDHDYDNANDAAAIVSIY